MTPTLLIRGFAFILILGLMSIGGFAADDVSDDALYDKVRIRLASDRVVGGGKIEVAVNKGVVQLTGTVKEEKHRSQAEKLAKKVKGVKSVDNKLRVGPI